MSETNSGESDVLKSAAWLTPLRLRALYLLAVLAGISAVIQCWQPVRNNSVRALVCLALLLFCVSVVVTTWKRFHLGKIMVLIIAVLGSYLLLTSEITAPADDIYVAKLKAYEGVTYVWGGETAQGIDCSGLIRAALRDALLEEGQYGAAARVWLKDVAASGLGEHYTEVLEHVGSFSSIRDLPEAECNHVHIAVTKSGVHTLAHIGNGEWIQASPGARKVIIKNASEDDPWFKAPVEIYRLKHK